MLKITRYDTPEAEERLNLLSERAGETAAAVGKAVLEIIEDIKSGGFEAVRKWSFKLDKAYPRLIEKNELEKAYNACGENICKALERACGNIKAYQSKLMPQGGMWDCPGGGRAGVIIRGLETAALYVPGGTAAYPSSVLMTAVPAKTAGVKNIVMLTPPTEHLKKEALAAAYIAGVDMVWAIGGVQAIAAAAFGLGGIPKADKIVGPGNAYVTAAKKALFGIVDIDSTAGPSEIFIIADKNADPDYIAADLLGQAEHDVLASCTIASEDEELLNNVSKCLCRRLETTVRRDIAEKSLRDYGLFLLCKDLSRAVDACNRLAPEHLELLTDTPSEILKDIKNAGAIFVGPYSPEPLGDYMAGPSHVLPTSGTARFFSPLSVDDFLKKTSIIEYDKESLSSCKDDIIAIAEREGLFAHAEAVKARFL